MDKCSSPGSCTDGDCTAPEIVVVGRSQDEEMSFLVGEEITLRLESSTSGTTYSDFTWSVPQDAFKEWIYTDNEEDEEENNKLPTKVLRLGQEDPLGKDLHRGTCIFNCTSPGSKSVSVRCKIDNGEKIGTYVTFNKSITVVRPSSSITPLSLGQTQIVLGGALLQLATEADVRRKGVELQGAVQMPPDQPAGKWAWLQLVTPSRSCRKNSTNTVINHPLNGQSGLDQNFPYLPHNDPRPGERSTNETHVFYDAPTTGLYPSFSRATVNDSFVLYLMFKPSGENSKYVPIRKYSWNWTANATGNEETGQWTTAPSPAVENGQEETSDHPSWDKVIKSTTPPTEP